MLPTQEQQEKLDQILLVYANGDKNLIEGMKFTYHALVSREFPASYSSLDIVVRPLTSLID